MNAVDGLDRALGFVRGLSLPDGRKLAETLLADPWLVDDVLTPILAQDTDGLPLHRRVWVELSRGHYKTNAVAAVAIVEALRGYGTDVVCIAADEDQARLVIEAIDGQCSRHPNLAEQFRPGRDEYRVPRNRSRIRIFASDAASFFGLGVDARRLRIICDEVTQWRQRDLWDAALSTLPKVRDSQLVAVTNAGIIGTWQEEVRATFAESGYLFAAPGIVASWIDAEEVDHLQLPEAVRRRYFGNEWVSAEGDFITREMLAACVDPDREPRLVGEPGVRYVVALDLGLTHDRTVRAVTHYDPAADTVVLDALRVWQGSKAEPVSIEAVEADLAQVDKAFGRPLFVADPWQFKGSVERLRGSLWIEEFAFSSPSIMRLSETLYSLINAGRLRLYPDAELQRELVALQVRQTSVGWRIDHGRGGFSDRAIAVGLAALRAVETGRRGASVDPSGGMTREEIEDAGGYVPEMADVRTKSF